MKPTEPLVLRMRRNRSFCFKWLGGLSLSRLMQKELAIFQAVKNKED
jgi:hypothetical protein